GWSVSAPSAVTWNFSASGKHSGGSPSTISASTRAARPSDLKNLISSLTQRERAELGDAITIWKRERRRAFCSSGRSSAEPACSIPSLPSVTFRPSACHTLFGNCVTLIRHGGTFAVALQVCEKERTATAAGGGVSLCE